MKQKLLKIILHTTLYCFFIVFLSQCKAHEDPSTKIKQLIQQGSYSKALVEVENWLKAAPTAKDALLIKADILNKTGETEQSRNLCKQILASDKNSAGAYSIMASISLTEKNYKEAIEACSQAITLDPALEDAYITKAATYDRMNDTQSTLQTFNKGLTQLSNSQRLFYEKSRFLFGIGDTIAAKDAINSAIDIDPHQINYLYKKVEIMSYLGQFEQALKILEPLSKANQNSADPDYWKGYILYEEGEDQKAEDALQTCLKKNPNYARAYAILGGINAAAGNFDKADEHIKKAAELNLRDPVVSEYCGIINVRKGRLAEAIQDFDYAIICDPSYPYAYISKADSLYQMRNFEECLRFTNTSLQRMKKSYDLYEIAGDIYSRQRNSKDAIDQYQMALSLYPESMHMLHRIALEYYYLDNYDKSKLFCNQALALEPEDAQAKNLLKNIKDANLPADERVVQFVQDNYLYMSEITEFDKKAEQFENLNHKDIALDVSKFIQSIKKKDDPFTKVYTGKTYDAITKTSSSGEASVHGALINSDLYYIDIAEFSENTGMEFKDIVDQIPDSVNQSLIINLMDNPGGLIEPSNEILDILLGECTTSYIVTRDNVKDRYFSDKAQVKFRNIFVLVNENSASSAEILTLGLKKHLNNVVIIGRPTFGKGVGQTILEDKKNKFLIYLVNFKWYVEMESVSGSHIQPDITVNGKTLDPYLSAIYKYLGKKK